MWDCIINWSKYFFVEYSSYLEKQPAVQLVIQAWVCDSLLTSGKTIRGVANNVLSYHRSVLYRSVSLLMLNYKRHKGSGMFLNMGRNWHGRVHCKPKTPKNSSSRVFMICALSSIIYFYKPLKKKEHVSPWQDTQSRIYAVGSRS